MTNTKTSNIKATVEQIKRLVKAGCQIVRMAIADMDDAEAIKEIKKQVDIPLVADIHFDYRLAIQTIENGIDKVRINPGNIGSVDRVKAVVEAAKTHNIPIRIGVNSGSVEKDLIAKYGGATPEAMLESMKRYVSMIEEMGFNNLVLSIKSTNIENTLITNRLLRANFNYPIHIGLTESGTFLSGAIRSSYALGTLINEGIGETIRVSLNGDPVNEIPACKEILSMCGKYIKPTLIACPTCGRTSYNMVPIVNEIEEFLSDIHKPLKVAIMGCVVNGPGEAREADIGIAGGIGEAVLFKKGQIIRKIPEDQLVQELKKEILEMTNDL